MNLNVSIQKLHTGDRTIQKDDHDFCWWLLLYCSKNTQTEQINLEQTKKNGVDNSHYRTLF